MALNLALTGPIAAVTAALNSESEVRVSSSQPVIEALRISGSLSASQAICWETGRVCEPVSSMLDVLFDKRVGKQERGLYRPLGVRLLVWLQCGKSALGSVSAPARCLRERDDQSKTAAGCGGFGEAG